MEGRGIGTGGIKWRGVALGLEGSSGGAWHWDWRDQVEGRGIGTGWIKWRGVALGLEGSSGGAWHWDWSDQVEGRGIGMHLSMAFEGRGIRSGQGILGVVFVNRM